MRCTTQSQQSINQPHLPGFFLHRRAALCSSLSGDPSPATSFPCRGAVVLANTGGTSTNSAASCLGHSQEDPAKFPPAANTCGQYSTNGKGGGIGREDIDCCPATTNATNLFYYFWTGLFRYDRLLHLKQSILRHIQASVRYTLLITVHSLLLGKSRRFSFLVKRQMKGRCPLRMRDAGQDVLRKNV